MVSKLGYDPDRDIPDLAGKVIFITGGTAGIGESTILNLMKHNPAHIHFTGRNVERANGVIAKAKKLSPNSRITFCECDHTSLESVNAAANAFLDTNPHRLDVLICNAGIMGGPLGLTKDGYEIQFGINFLSYALLTKRFLPLLEKTAAKYGDARIVNPTSTGYKLQSIGPSFDELKTTCANIGFGQQWKRYGQSKFAQVLYTSELARRYPGITSVAIYPGVVLTGLVENLPFYDRWWIKAVTLGSTISLKEGPYNSCRAATTPKDGIKSGGIYWPVGVLQKPTKEASDKELWEKFWERIQQQLDGYS